MDEFIHHRGSVVEDEMSKYEGTILELNCNVDRLSYFVMVCIVKDLGYMEMVTIW